MDRSLAWLWIVFLGAFPSRGEPIDFNRDIRPILSDRCLVCHGPDPAQRKAGLRLDTEEGSRRDLGGYAAVVPGDPERSELLSRVAGRGEDRMPPPETGKGLAPEQILLLRRWIEQGGDYSPHWAYVPPRRPEPPANRGSGRERNPIDAFVLARLEARGLEFSPDASPALLARRAALDLTGLPPGSGSLEAFLSDSRPGAWERYVERLLHHPGFGERWASMWMDLARYADSAGYADDPPRTIWAWRDWVIDAYNRNMPYDQFTVEQLAGDLLPGGAESRLVATAFHRNTMTNNEGGTSDEQFRNEAVVDRVNTTMQVWMGTTMACAQCHTHKYDPITQEEYFRMFAIFNNTEDSDKRNEQPTIPLYSARQQEQKRRWLEEIASLEERLARPDPAIGREREEWLRSMRQAPRWEPIRPLAAEARGRRLEIGEDGDVRARGERPERDVYRVGFEVPAGGLRALRLRTGPQKDNFALSRAELLFEPEAQRTISARHVRISLEGKERILSLAEVQVFAGEKNLAPGGTARQSSTAFEGPARLAIDGSTDGDYDQGSTTHTAISDDPWWELDLGEARAIDRVVVWNRTHSEPSIGERLAGFRLQLLDGDRKTLWEQVHAEAPSPRAEIAPGGPAPVALAEAHADYSQDGFEASSALLGSADGSKAWAVGGQTGKPHWLVLVLEEPLEAAAGSLSLVLRQESRHDRHLIDSFSLEGTGDPVLVELSRLPPGVQELLELPPGELEEAQREELAAAHRRVSRTLRPLQLRLEELQAQAASQKPLTTVPVMRELEGDRRRVTRVQARGDYKALEAEVVEGTPAVFHAPEQERPDRLGLARWLVSRENPLTARVLANRYWERLFGTGLVATSEEFGSQGDLPTHPLLLDWLAVELMESGWDRKRLLRLILNSTAYRQSSRTTPFLREADPGNRWLSRGPRIRLEAEMVRDQALAIGGLLDGSLHGPPVRPPQPPIGLSAAFGGGIDWKASQGGDRYRRGLYTQWRRSNPYPSMVSFDAPSREVCTVRRPRSNTPLQALVTLNDPVYVEAAQGLARRVAEREGGLRSRVSWAFVQCLARDPSAGEAALLEELYEDAVGEFSRDPEAARQWAGSLPGTPGSGDALVELAAWTALANTLLNLDELFLKP